MFLSCRFFENFAFKYKIEYAVHKRFATYSIHFLINIQIITKVCNEKYNKFYHGLMKLIYWKLIIGANLLATACWWKSLLNYWAFLWFYVIYMLYSNIKLKIYARNFSNNEIIWHHGFLYSKWKNLILWLYKSKHHYIHPPYDPHCHTFVKVEQP